MLQYSTDPNKDDTAMTQLTLMPEIREKIEEAIDAQPAAATLTIFVSPGVEFVASTEVCAMLVLATIQRNNKTYRIGIRTE